EMALIECGLRSLEKKARRTGSEKRGLEFEFGGSIERERTQCLCASPAIFSSCRNGLVERAQSRRWRNFFEEVRSIGIARTEPGQFGRRRVPEVGLREALDSLVVEAAGMPGITFAFRVAAKPVECVNSIC